MYRFVFLAHWLKSGMLQYTGMGDNWKIQNEKLL